jgi:7-cyano-7-deazaguanine synthase
MVKQGKRAVVVLSGGQDSTTALFWAKTMFDEVLAVSFDYGQRHKIELQSAVIVAAKAGVPHEIIDAKFINTLAANALTRKNIDVECPEGKLPTTFVDGRNLFFLSMAAVYAKQRGIHDLVTGVCQTDYSGYPDCRMDFIASLRNTLVYAMDYEFSIHVPMMFLTKAQEVELAVSLGVDCLDALSQSHTCYEGVFPPCGKCPACKLRAKGFKEAGYSDPLIVRANLAGSYRPRM